MIWQIHSFLYSQNNMICQAKPVASLLTSMEKVVGPRMSRNSSSLELVVQHSVSSSRARPATHGSTNRAGNPATNSCITMHIGEHNILLKNVSKQGQNTMQGPG